MGKINLITCIVERGRRDLVVRAALEEGAQGATFFNGKGTGVRQALGITVTPGKEIILIVTKDEQTDPVFDAVVAAGRLDEKGQGFAYYHSLDRAVGFLEHYGD